jgi:hypothetical protein
MSVSILPKICRGVTINVTVACCVALSSIYSAQAANMVVNDSFDSENGGNRSLNYFDLRNWNVTQGSVNLLGSKAANLFPDNVLFLYLHGSSADTSTIESKTAFNLKAGDTIELQFDLGGSKRGKSGSINVSLGDLFNETIDTSKLDPTQPFTTFIRTITVTSDTLANLKFEYLGDGGIGLFLDNIKLGINPIEIPPIVAVYEPTMLWGMAVALSFGIACQRKSSKKA